MFEAAPLSFAAIPRSAFGRAAMHLPGTPTPAKVRAEQRYARAAKLAADVLPTLPEPGTTVHTILTGFFDLTTVIVDVASRIPELRSLRMATLAYSRRNTTELLGLLESRPGLAFTLLTSEFHRSHNKELHEEFLDNLKAFPSARLAAARNHAKVVCFEWPDDGLTFLTSANARSNRNTEFLTATRDRELCRWYSDWIDSQVRPDAES